MARCRKAPKPKKIIKFKNEGPLLKTFHQKKIYWQIVQRYKIMHSISRSPNERLQMRKDAIFNSFMFKFKICDQ